MGRHVAQLQGVEVEGGREAAHAQLEEGGGRLGDLGEIDREV